MQNRQLSAPTPAYASRRALRGASGDYILGSIEIPARDYNSADSLSADSLSADSLGIYLKVMGNDGKPIHLRIRSPKFRLLVPMKAII